MGWLNERIDTHLLEIAQALLFEMNVSKTFWADVIQIVAFLINRLPTHILGYKSPIEVVSLATTLFPSSSKVFGCICFVHVDQSSRFKLGPKALKCIFLGYSST